MKLIIWFDKKKNSRAPRLARFIACPIIGHLWYWRGRSRSGNRCWVCPRCHGLFETPSRYAHPKRWMRAYYVR